jgi:hypothetical protein
MDNIKHKKAASIRLRRAFKIANMQAAKAIPEYHKTVGSWIDEMFKYFEPYIQEEIHTAKSRIYISFNGWGLKHEKLSVISIVIYFINAKYKAVTRLIGLPELPGHRKARVVSHVFSSSELAAILFLLEVLFFRIG